MRKRQTDIYLWGKGQTVVLDEKKTHVGRLSEEKGKQMSEQRKRHEDTETASSPMKGK